MHKQPLYMLVHVLVLVVCDLERKRLNAPLEIYRSNSLFQSLGNHEFDEGVEGLTPFIEAVTCPVLAANLDLSHAPKLANQQNRMNSAIFNISGVDVGIIGYVTPKTKLLVKKNNVQFTDEITAITREIEKLKQEGVRIFIALGHSGYKMEKDIAENVEDLHLVVGGHDHTLLWSNARTPDIEEIQGPYPTYIKQPSGKTVPVLHTYGYTKYIGKILMTFNSNAELVYAKGSSILLDHNIPEDPVIKNIVEKYHKKTKHTLSEVVGNTSVILDARNCGRRECNLGNLITDSMVYYYAQNYKGEHWTNAPIAIIQAGAIKTSIFHSEMPSPITKEDLLMTLPFLSYLERVQMNGTILKRMLEHSVSNYDDDKIGREFLQVAGLQVVYKPRNAPGDRVVSLKARCWQCDIPKYYIVDNEEIYPVLMPDFLKHGGDNYKMLTDLPYEKLPYRDINCLERYIKHHSFVFPQVEGRIKLID